MGEKVRKQSEIPEMMKSGAYVIEPPRHVVRHKPTGQIAAHMDLLPDYFVTKTTHIFYNDTGLRDFIQSQTNRVLEALKDANFNLTGQHYEQFLEHYEFCQHEPSEKLLDELITRSRDLNIEMKDAGIELTEAMHPSRYTEQVEPRFWAATEAHLHLFVFRLVLILARYGKIDNSARQLRMNLEDLEVRLQTLLQAYIYNRPNGTEQFSNTSRGKSLYGWTLLKNRDLEAATFLHHYDSQATDVPFGNIFSEVMAVFDQPYNRDDTLHHILQREFSNPYVHFGMPPFRSNVALKLCFCLENTQRIRQYIDELTAESEDEKTPLADFSDFVKDLLLPFSVQ